MIVLEEDLRFDRYTAPISLPEEEDFRELYSEGSPVTVIGWGFTEQGRTSYTLQVGQQCWEGLV